MAEIFNDQRILGVEEVDADMKIYNDQPVRGVVVVDANRKMFNNQPVLGVYIMGGDGNPNHGWLRHIIARASALGWNGTNLVGDGVTLSPQTTAPIAGDGFLTFDGVNNALVGAVDLDITGKSVLMVARARAATSAQQSLWSMTGAGGYVQVEARSNPPGQFQGAHRSHASFGFGATQIAPATAFNTFVDQAETVAVYVSVYGTDRACQAVGSLTGQAATSSDIARHVSALAVGRSTLTTFAAFDFFDLVILDSVDPVIVGQAAHALRDLYAASSPNFTRLFRTNAAGLSDSIGVGVGATGTNDFYRQTLKNFVVTRTTNGFAGSQISPYGLTNQSQIDAAFANVTNRAAPFTGNSCVLASFGTNDYGAIHGGVPLGLDGDTSDQTFNGALNIGWTRYLANSPPDQIVFMFTPVPRFDKTGANTAGHTLADYAQAIRDFVARTASPRLHLIEMMNCGLTAADTTDNLHPNNAGHALMATHATPQIMAVLSR